MGKNNFVDITQCRLCKSRSLKSFVNFGNVALGNDLQTSANKAKLSNTYPLNIMRCNNCHHFQLSVSVDPGLLYANNYTYLSSIGKTFVEHLSQYADWVHSKVLKCEKSFVIDVGSNDGTCLSFFKKLGHNVLGIDPAKLPSDIANRNGILTYNNFLNDDLVEKILIQHGPADFITSHNVLAHVDDLIATFNCIYKLLRENGTFIFEVGYFHEVLKNGFFDTTYHEHIDYHHARPLCRFLNSIGFEINHISTNSVQGGSIRIHLKKSLKANITKQANYFLFNEKLSILYDKSFLDSWSSIISNKMSEFQRNIIALNTPSNKIIGYGVPTKATLLLKMANLSNEEICFFVEDNPLKTNKFLPETAIPILPFEVILEERPNVIIIFAWNFSEDIISKIKTIINWPVICVVPLPQCRYVEI